MTVWAAGMAGGEEAFPLFIAAVSRRCANFKHEIGSKRLDAVGYYVKQFESRPESASDRQHIGGEA